MRLAPSADVFAVAVLLMELWTGKPAFRRHFLQQQLHARGEVAAFPPEVRKVQSEDAAIVIDKGERFERRHLHDCAKRASQQTNRKGHPHHPFFAGDANLDASAVSAQRNQGGHALIQKVCEIYLLARFVQDLVLR